MTLQPSDVRNPPNPIATHYSRFRVSERLLLTGHSHQAWPDVGFAAHQQAWEDAAELVDDKWERAFAQAERVRRGWAALLGDDQGHITLGSNTHELVVRVLSALPLRDRPRLITTDGEFHTIRRQLDRLAEAGIEIVKVSADPAHQLAARLIEALDDRAAAVLVSSVLYRNAHVVPDLSEVQAACARHGAELVVDAYHALNVLPFAIGKEGLQGAFVIGGGYKYCQLGEGNCFLRTPPDCRMRPVITGWFSEFGTLSGDHRPGVVEYGDGPDRFAGATYDPTSHYRAAAVFDFFWTQDLTPAVLRAVSQHQIHVLMDAFDALDLPPGTCTRDRAVSLDRVGGFLALSAPRATQFSAQLRKRKVYTDARADVLRFGPAPYLHDGQLRDAIAMLGEIIESS